MKKNKKVFISIAISILIVSLGIFIFYKFFYNANKLSLSEKEWLNKNKSSVITINLPNDLNIFAKNGKGVFYDFISGLEKANEMQINKNIIPLGEENGLSFTINSKIDKDDLLIFRDHYVVVGKEHLNIHNLSDLNGKNVGVIGNNISRITDNYNLSLNIALSENKESLLENLKNDKVSFIIIPLNEYIDEILINNYQIIYHLDDISNNYYLNLGSDKTLNSIIKKYYNEWITNQYEESYYNNLYELFVDKLGINQIELDTLTSKNYTFGFVKLTPYQTLNSSKYGGKIIAYLEDFSRFSNVSFIYTKYKNSSDLLKAYDNNKVDLLFDNTSYNYKGVNINTNINNKYYLIAPIINAYKVNNIKDLNKTEIYVLKDSKISANLKQYENITIKTVNTEKDLIKATSKGKIIAIDSNSYNYLVNTKIKKYNIIYEEYLPNYSFKYQSNDTFKKLFESYINYLSDYNINSNGILSFYSAESSGNLISTIAKYILLIISLVIVIIGIVIASKKHLKLQPKRIKKDEKLKYIDMLTSLKNRNYLNERINLWNENTIYPQAIIVIDLNNIKYLNDTFGSKEGDKQIMAAANILHQTQLDNTEIMRTDGNEFTIYLVGYNEKQVINYMKKLVKEFNELPYEYGAAFGFSMIVDDLKLIDDAINEATLQMRENKEIENEKSDNENK